MSTVIKYDSRKTDLIVDSYLTNIELILSCSRDIFARQKWKKGAPAILTNVDITQKYSAVLNKFIYC